MKYILPILLLLTSCTKVYHEVYSIEKYPIEWDEEIVFNCEHQHYTFDDGVYKCLYIEPDTIIWRHFDTIVVRKYEGLIRVK